MKRIAILVAVALIGCTDEEAPVPVDQTHECLILFRCGFEDILGMQFFTCASGIDEATDDAQRAGFKQLSIKCPGEGRWVRTECSLVEPSMTCERPDQ